ncbi:MAG: hypothetical protein LBU58_09455 [Clostridiales bacterium]|jgi:hypothetical protein|nr:hypothetical protein [Clostridiales bacterium]
MNGPIFFILLIVGMAFVLMSVLLFARDYRKGKKLLERAAEEKEELLSIIGDAELMVNELNNFSDYILSRIDSKSSEVGEVIEKLGETLERAAGKVGAVDKAGAPADHAGRVDNTAHGRRSVRYRVADSKKAQTYRLKSGARPRAVPNAAPAPSEMQAEAQAAFGRRDETFVPAPVILFPVAERADRRKERRQATLSRNRKCVDVIKYAEDGMDEAEIARKLNIGRGEVALVLGLRDGFLSDAEL